MGHDTNKYQWTDCVIWADSGYRPRRACISFNFDCFHVLRLQEKNEGPTLKLTWELLMLSACIIFVSCLVWRPPYILKLVLVCAS